MAKVISMEKSIESFWRWFSSRAEKLERSNFSDNEVIAELDRQLLNIDSRINWEIGPGAQASCQLVISPNYDESLIPICSEILAYAPLIKNWIFFLYKPRKLWKNNLVVHDVGGQAIYLDTSRWTYVLLRYPEGDSEVLIAANQKLPFDKASNLRWQSGALVLEALLGEEIVMTKVQTWDVVDFFDHDLGSNARGLSDLPVSFNL